MNILNRKKKLTIHENISEAKHTLKDYEQENELPHSESVDKLTIVFSIVLLTLMTEQKMMGTAVIFVGEDLDVLLELCDRILVLCAGQVSGVVDARTAAKEEIGLLMTSVGGKEEA